MQDLLFWYNGDMEKNRFNINQVSKMTGLSAHTLRYYEKIGLLQNVSRDSNGYRQYGETDLAWIHFLIRLKETGMPISRMKQFSDLRSQGFSTVAERRKLLELHRKQVMKHLDDLVLNLSKIEEKIDYYKKLEKENERNPV